MRRARRARSPTASSATLTDAIAGGLAARGVGEGDAVGVFLPMLPETVATVMAVAKLGAIFLPIFSGYGADAVAVRLEEGEAKALVTADGTTRRGKVVPMKATADAAVATVPSVETVVVVDRLGIDVPMQPDRDLTLAECRALAPSDRFETPAFDAEHPLFIAYTSGTTGKPKGVVHVHGGFVVKIAEEVGFQADCRSTVTGGDRDDVLFWLTDLGWIMGPWQIFGTLAWGATMFCYDGAPDHPGPGPAVGDGRASSHLDPRHLADARARARWPRATNRSAPTTCRRCGCSVPRASRGTKVRGGGTSAPSAAGGARSST